MTNEMRKLMEAVDFANQTVTDMEPDWPHKPEDFNPKKKIKEDLSPEEYQTKVHLLVDAQNDLLEVINRIESIIEDTPVYAYARSYWLAQLKIAASEDHEFMTRDPNLGDAIQELQKLSEHGAELSPGELEKAFDRSGYRGMKIDNASLAGTDGDDQTYHVEFADDGSFNDDNDRFGTVYVRWIDGEAYAET